MRIISLLLVIVFLAGCQDAPTTKRKRHKTHAISTPKVINPKEITSDQYSIIVPDSWMQEYERMETKSGKTVPGDSIIWQEGARYHIPVDVAQNYIELKKSEAKRP